MKKRLLPVLLTVSLAISISGCNRSGEPSVDTAQEASGSSEAEEDTEEISQESVEQGSQASAEEAPPESTGQTEETTEAENMGYEEEKPVEEMVYEAEDAQLYGALRISSDRACSGGKVVENFASETDYICFDIEIAADGMYDITFVSSGIGSYKENNTIVDGIPIGVFTSEKDKFSESVIPSISLTEGSHELKITPSWGWMRLDCVKITAAEGIKDDIYTVDDTLINENADERARALFTYLSECYGEYILSGQVCDGGINGLEFSAIYEETGKYPAILGLDMMDYTPSRVELGTKSNAVERAIEFNEMGGIVTFCWHWNAPTAYMKNGTDENGNPRWWGAFYTANTDFDIEKVMNGEDQEGMAYIVRDIEEIARQLKRLEEAGVPVLWRPLHEASGGWFWWGAKGAEAYKKLWIYLYQELTYTYGCNNLIWVFNGQNDEWYPGDEYVDIIGEDIYPGERVYSPQTARFKQAVDYTDANKIIALTENGCVFDIDQAWEANTKWLWFCTWCGDFVLNGSSYSERYTELEILQKAYSSPYVITLEELPELY